jgi:1,2-diacylglycerol 3-alpha-glucosyltransferase
MKTAVIFDNFGPYHVARLNAAAQVCELTGIQICSHSVEYAWENKVDAIFKHVTLFQQESPPSGHRQLLQKMTEALDDCRPQVVFIPGWSSHAAIGALSWCTSHKVPAIVMSESTAWDEKRSWRKESVKRRLIALCSAALVGGSPHTDYIAKLGMSPDHVFVGYDAVDNDYFQQKTEEVRTRHSVIRAEERLPSNYFLASARFIEKKNLPRLIEAYARYRVLSELTKSENPMLTPPRSLVLLGDGPLRKTLETQLSALGLHDHVFLPGFKQYPELPAYYALADVFIHASTTEQWGLVVNEAMASGLPVLVSKRCGCAADLVQEGMNGFIFDPYNTEDLAQLMLKVTALDFPLSKFGSMSRQIIANWGPKRFVSGLKAASETASQMKLPSASWPSRLLLSALLHR